MSTLKQMAQQSMRYYTLMQEFKEPLRLGFGVNYFFYLRVTPDKKCSFLGSNPELVEHYIAHNMFQKNPFFTRAHDVQTGAYLYSSMDDTAFQATMQELESIYKIRHTFLLTRHDTNGLHYYGFAQDPKALRSNELFFNSLALLQKFDTTFQHEMGPILQDLQEDAVTLNFAPSIRRLPQVALDSEQVTRFIQELTGDTIPTPVFSRREKEVIYHMLRGKSAPSIAKTLGLSARTVEHYIISIKNKTNCSTKSELIEALQMLVP